MFDNLYNLITYYRSHPLRSQNFSQILTEPIPQQDGHKNKPYDVAGLSLVLPLCCVLLLTLTHIL